MHDFQYVSPDRALAETLFDALYQCGFDGRGITRDTYGVGEQRAHKIISAAAEKLGLIVQCDAALNLYMLLPGSEPDKPMVVTGSHLDSVPCGGNFDGAAGVVAGMAILAGWVRAGIRPRRTVCVMGIRAEESAWFPVSYVGSKAAFGKLESSALDCCRRDSERTLSEHLTLLGGDPDAVAAGQKHLYADKIDSFAELHIEQGPVLIGSNTTLGVVTGICGSLRYRDAHIVGEYMHSGATPRKFRQDAVVAFSQFVANLQQYWAEMEAEGHELTLTFGKVNTDPIEADFSKVCGHVSFCIDIRSHFPETLQKMDSKIQELVSELEDDCGVRFTLGPQSASQPGTMDTDLQQQLIDAANTQNISWQNMPSGAGHDASTFSNQGIPTAMLFVCNRNGSHNPDEALDMDDFYSATSVLGQVLAQRAGLRLSTEKEIH